MTDESTDCEAADEDGTTEASADAGAGVKTGLPDVSALDDIDDDLDTVADALDAATTEDDLDSIEATLDDIETLLSETDDETFEEPSDRLATLRDDLAAARGPYAEDITTALESAATTVRDTRWTEDGVSTVVTATDETVTTVSERLEADLTTAVGTPEECAAALDAAATAVEKAELETDADDDTLAALDATTDALSSGLDDAEEWDDLDKRARLRAEGFYDVLGHYKDFPPEWAALKEHEQRGNVELVLLALDTLDSEFMEEHCLAALARMNDDEAVEAMHQRAEKRDLPGIRALGKMGATETVETLLEYVDEDANPQLQRVTFRALGEIGDERATEPLARKLTMDNDDVRPHAARALGLLGDTRAIPPLSATVENDPDASVRAAAAWGLRQIGTATALEAAAAATADPSYLVQHEAEQAATALAVPT